MSSIEGFISTLVNIYQYVLIAYVLLSWLPNARESFIGEILAKLCEPYLGLFRRFIPPIGGMIDISPIVALIALRFIGMGLAVVIGYIIP
ncbi:YggT family protein [Paenibacillus validus]|uniref:YggT family protein n=1 Tax=Paenibacillus validus TaxID=44253 RepID=A0A7X2ZCV1_9BACL|nr:MULTISPECIES: YggT family protein [Paenibacillus]MED4603629.1 YggT family protein [Paenibacillus validus]MED4605808.1 YggT family protein [Paenibacillus validus]MUG72613.1 YggT family protein [Paenibacillus validus]